MKAKVKIALPGYTGNMDDMVIYYNSTLNCLIARKKVIPKFTPNNKDVKDSFALARRLVLSHGFLDDCKAYIRLYNQKNRRKNRALTSWPAVWLKMMKSFIKQYPDIGLDNLSRDEIVSRQLPIRSIEAAIKAGYLEPVPNAAVLNSIL